MDGIDRALSTSLHLPIRPDFGSSTVLMLIAMILVPKYVTLYFHIQDTDITNLLF